MRFVLDVLRYIISEKSVRLCGFADFFLFFVVGMRGGMGRGSVGVGL